MTKHDRDALKLAMETCRAEEGRAEQLDYMVKQDGWRYAATFSAYHCQMQSLDLCPWEEPPCWQREDDDSERNAPAVKLLKRMLAAGVSRYHPDPLKALAGARRSSR